MDLEEFTAEELRGICSRALLDSEDGRELLRRQLMNKEFRTTNDTHREVRGL